MSKSVMEQSMNKVNIVGKLLECTFSSGLTKSDKRPWERASMTLRVNQTYDSGLTETSEISIPIFATQYTNKGTPHPGYKCIQDLKNCKTIQDFGEAEATTIRISNATLGENIYVANSGQVVDTWQINTSFANAAQKPVSQIATFNNDIFIMDMHEEYDREGDPTGNLIIKGGIVQYGGRLDVIEFVVEEADKIDYIQRNWEVNDTVNVGGRIRYTSKEENANAVNENSWGESLPMTTTRVVRQLVITRGSNEPYEEDMAYDPVEIKKLFNERKAMIEQKQVDAKQGASHRTAASGAGAGANKYSWE